MKTKTKSATAENYILTYYQAIKNGSEIVGEWVLLLYEYIVQGLQNKEFFYDGKKARRAIRFIENYCHHSKGRNDLIKLELWEKAFVSTLFGIVDDKGLRQFREILLVVGRKNGKSLIAASIMDVAAFVDGEYGAEIYCLAPKLEQAEIVYNCFWQMTQAEPETKQLIRSRKSDYFIEDTNSTIKKIAFNHKKSDGFNPHVVVCDEVASWVGEAGKKQYEVMKSALGARRQPMILSCTTSGYVNGGIYDELILRATRFLRGDSKEKRFLPVLYMIDDIEKWNDINEIKKSMPNLGVSVTYDYILEEIAVAEGSLSKRAEFICKYCNLKQNSSTAWISAKVIEKAGGDPVTMQRFNHHYCVAGVDLSQTTDLTSACLVIEDNDELFVLSHFWLPSEKLSDAIARDGLPYDEYIQKGWLSLAGENFVDYKAVYAWLVQAVEQYKLLPLKVGYDRYSSQYLVQDLEAYGFQTDDVYQGYNLTGVIYEAEGLLKDGKINLGDNDLLKIHLLDTALETDTRVGRVKIAKVSKNSHVDGVAALLDALTVRQKWYSEIGARLKNNKKKEK